MSKINKSRKKVIKKTGLPPGSVVFTGNRQVEQVLIHYLLYDPDKLEDKTFDNHKDITFHQSKDEVVDWYDIRGLHDTKLIELLGQTFTIHPLILEDVADIHQRPKNGLQDLYLSEISFRMNQVMQVLTIITTIFVPLSFLAGMYGMNFEYIPELQYRYGYFVLLGVMVFIAAGLLFYFKKKKWF